MDDLDLASGDMEIEEVKVDVEQKPEQTRQPARAVCTITLILFDSNSILD